MASSFVRAPLALVTAGAAILACSDSLHLDPDPQASASSGAGASGGGGGGPSGGGGGAAPIACVSSTDCPAPTSVCDTADGQCVECLEIEDCAFRPSTVCSQGECVCPAEGATFCPAASASGDVRPARCVDLAVSGDDCGSCGHRCYGACAAGKCVDAWEPTPVGDAPSPRARHACASTGTSFFVWGGEGPGGVVATGGVLDAGAGAWSKTSLGSAPAARNYAQAVWTGERIFVWGGHDGGKPVGTGALYDPKANVWAPVTTAGAPSPRYLHSMVWADSVKRVLVWGGYDGTDNLDSGAQLDPATGAWSPMATEGAPPRRRDAASAWTGTHFVVYGGIGFDGTTDDVHLDGGKRFDPATNAWDDLPTAGQPSARARTPAAFGAGSFVVWGGEQPSAPSYSGDGARFAAGAWASLGGPNPSPRRLHTAVFVPDPVARVVVFGGDGPAGRLADGGIFDPAGGAWSTKPMPTGPSARNWHCAGALGERLVIWGGEAPGYTDTGAVLDVAAAL